ncbi:MAG: dolichol kinase [Ignavibacteriales bacterium]|nr:dolichol kinase [Ignavibacteriales bacterium]
MIESDYRIEVIRKAIHLISLSIPITYYFVSKPVALTLLVPMTLIFLSSDLARYYNQAFEKWYFKYFGFLLRKRENDKKNKTLNGATYVLISATFCVLVFPKIIMITSFSILIISDIAAALIGRRFGKHKFISKSVEGSSAFFFTALIVIIVTPKVEYQLGEYLIGIIAALIGTVTEALPADIDDNLSIPISVGASLWLLYTIFLPILDIYKLG